MLVRIKWRRIVDNLKIKSKLRTCVATMDEHVANETDASTFRHFPLKPRSSQASILARVTELNARSTVYQRNCGNLERRNNRGVRARRSLRV